MPPEALEGSGRKEGAMVVLAEDHLRTLQALRESCAYGDRRGVRSEKEDQTQARGGVPVVAHKHGEQLAAASNERTVVHRRLGTLKQRFAVLEASIANGASWTLARSWVRSPDGDRPIQIQERAIPHPLSRRGTRSGAPRPEWHCRNGRKGGHRCDGDTPHIRPALGARQRTGGLAIQHNFGLRSSRGRRDRQADKTSARRPSIDRLGDPDYRGLEGHAEGA